MKIVTGSPRHEHLARGQQRRRVSDSVRCRGCRCCSRCPSPDHTAPRCSRPPNVLPPPAPCLRAAASRCERRVRCQGCRCCSRCPWPDRTVPRCSRARIPFPPPPAPCLRAAASRCETRVRWRGCRCCSSSRRRIIQLRAAQETKRLSAGHQHLAGGQQRRRVIARARWRGCRSLVHVPVAGSYSSALLKTISQHRFAAATSTLPEGNSVAV